MINGIFHFCGIFLDAAKMQSRLSFLFYLDSVGGEMSPLPLLQHVVGRVQPAVGNNLFKGRSFPGIETCKIKLLII